MTEIKKRLEHLPDTNTKVALFEQPILVLIPLGIMSGKISIKTEEDLRAALEGLTQFQIEVLVETFKIPKGKISTYSRIANKAGKPSAHRAVANTLNKCPYWPIVPCHRVVKSDGGFGGDTKSAARRRLRVRDEGVPIKNGKVDLKQDVLF